MAKRKPTRATAAAARILGAAPGAGSGENARLAGLPKDRSVVVAIRLPPAVKAQLTTHFRARGTDLSQGLRTVIMDYVRGTLNR